MGNKDDFIRLFRGREDGYGTVEGLCVKEPLTDHRWGLHLFHPGMSIGVYPLFESDGLASAWAERMGGPVGTHFVNWGCSDIDNKADPEACWPLARNLQNALAALRIEAWVERTKGKGYHVWVFAEEPVPAVVMRRALLVAHQVAGVAPTEVNPKQIDHKSTTWGNYVNLPYPEGWQDSGKRVVMQAQDVYLSLGDFAWAAVETRAPFDNLYEAAKLYKEPPKPSVARLDEPPSARAAELAKLLPGLPYKIFTDGVLPGRDRSGTLTRLAHLCAESGFKAADTLELVTDADRRWGKFADRADGAEQLEKIVVGVYR